MIRAYPGSTVALSTIDRHDPGIEDCWTSTVNGATTATDGEHDCNLRVRDELRELAVAWFRPMGAAEVAYHQETVVGRGDDHPGRALAYYGSRGETPLRWGGVGAARLDLTGEVTPDAYEAAFGPGGFRDPATGTPLVASKRPRLRARCRRAQVGRHAGFGR